MQRSAGTRHHTSERQLLITGISKPLRGVITRGQVEENEDDQLDSVYVV